MFPGGRRPCRPHCPRPPPPPQRCCTTRSCAGATTGRDRGAWRPQVGGSARRLSRSCLSFWKRVSASLPLTPISLPNTPTQAPSRSAACSAEQSVGGRRGHQRGPQSLGRVQALPEGEPADPGPRRGGPPVRVRREPAHAIIRRHPCGQRGAVRPQPRSPRAGGGAQELWHRPVGRQEHGQVSADGGALIPYIMLGGGVWWRALILSQHLGWGGVGPGTRGWVGTQHILPPLPPPFCPPVTLECTQTHTPRVLHPPSLALQGGCQQAAAGAAGSV